MLIYSPTNVFKRGRAEKWTGEISRLWPTEDSLKYVLFGSARVASHTPRCRYVQVRISCPRVFVFQIRCVSRIHRRRSPELVKGVI